MKIPIKRAVAVGLVGAAVVTGGGIAIAAGTKDERDQERQAYLDSAAKRLGTTSEKVESALQGAFEDRLDAAVQAGRLTQEEADRIKQRAKDGGPGGFGFGPGFGPGPGGGGPGHRGGPFGPGVLMEGIDAAADYLGITGAQLREQLRSGKSLADVAKARNKDTAGLKAALKAAAEKRLADAVKDKRLTQAQADRFAEELDEHLDEFIAGDGPRRGGPGHGRGRGFPGHGFGPGGRGGPGQAPSATPTP